jgi:glycosyltransferase involved in cell wall biosynthesis
MGSRLKAVRHGEPLRILHLPVLVLNQGTLLCRSLRRRGHTCDYLVFDIPDEDANLHHECDINLRLTRKGYLERVRTVAGFLRENLDRYDIFHFHSGRTLVPLMAFSRWSFLPNRLGRYLTFLDFLDLPYLKSKGKKLVFQFWGCDIRDPGFDLRYPDSTCLVCPDSIRKTHCNPSLKEKMNRVTLKYGDARLSSGDLNVCYRDFLWVENAIDTDEWRPVEEREIPERLRWKGSAEIKVYHSFSKSDIRNDVKGTTAITRAVEELRQEGHSVELMFFNYLPHEEIRYYQAQADIVVDQLKCGHYGNTAVECLSMGKPVICHLRDDVEERMPKGHPILKADTRTVKDVLRMLIVDKEKRRILGEQSRAYALRHHGLDAVGRRMEEIYLGLYEGSSPSIIMN